MSHTQAESGRRVGPVETYAKIPTEILTHPDLGPAAVRVWAYSYWRLGLPGWILRKADIQKKCGVGNIAWSTAIKELTIAGLYELDRFHLPAGTIDETGKSIGGRKGIEHVFYWPGFRDEAPISTTAPPEPRGRSKSAHSLSGGRPPAPPLPRGHIEKQKNINTNTKKAAEEAPHAAPTATAAAPTALAERKGQKRIHCNGIESWYESDVVAAEILTTAESDAEIRAAVAAVTARGQSPVAELVRREILRRRSRPKSRGMQAMDALDDLAAQFKRPRPELRS